MAQDEDLPPPKADFSAPPPYELVTSDNNQTHSPENQDQSDYPPPPPSAESQQLVMDLESGRNHNNNNNPGNESTNEAALPSKLPTYEEVEMEKTRLGEMPMDLTANTFPMHGRIPPPSHPVLISALRNAHGQATFIAIEAGDAQGTRHHHHHVSGNPGVSGVTAASVDNSLLGTDFMFIAAFIVAFLFNWIGFLMLTCFFHTIAARYGALSGFGLSLAKWTLIVKKSTDLANHESSWLWWLIMSFGCLICVRALVQYVSIKRTWRMMSASAQERLLFFY